RVYAGPTGGGAAQPAFRALVAGDLPAGADTRLTATGVTSSGSTISIIETPALAEEEAYAIDGFVFGAQGNFNNTQITRFHAVFSRQLGSNIEVNGQLVNSNG